MNITKELIEDNIVVSPTGCWEWQGAVGTHGYGRLGARLIHRASYELHKGPIPELDLVLHTCDNRICCNPEHLFTGQHLDNTLDGLKKGRIKRFQPRKLTDEQVDQIRQLVYAGHEQKEVAQQFNIRQSYVSRLSNFDKRFK